MVGQNVDAGEGPIRRPAELGGEETGEVIPVLIAARARCSPDTLALWSDREVLHYAGLIGRADDLARRLVACGVRRGMPVGLYCERSPALVVAALAVLRAGAAYLPLDPAHPRARCATTLEDAGVEVLLCQEHLLAAAPRGAWNTLPVDALPVEEPASTDLPAVTADDLAYVIYTSGSTGRPKGVAVTHANLLNLVRWHCHAFAVHAGVRAAQVAGSAFDAFGWEVWPYLAAGAAVYIVPEHSRTDAAQLRDALVDQSIAISFAPTVLAEELIGLPWPANTALRTLLTGGDALHRYPAPDLPFRLVNNYGPTECTVVATSAAIEPAPTGSEPPTIGRAIDGARAYVLDERLRPVRAGEIGELFVGGGGVARGYWRDPVLTAERFLRDPFSGNPGDRLYRTGDLCRLAPDGLLHFAGRNDQQVKIRGYRIEPGEIEAAIARYPGVRRAVVTAYEDAGERRLAAHVAVEPAADLSPAALTEFLAESLPAYMIPATLIRLHDLPRTPNGKVDRAALPDPLTADRGWIEHSRPPRTATEQAVAEILCTLLEREFVGADDNFFLLGGHSLLGAQLLTRVHDTFGIDLPLLTVFEAPTVAQLAARIEELILAEIEALSDDDVRRLLA